MRDTGIYLIFIMDIICPKNLLSISLFPVIPVRDTGIYLIFIMDIICLKNLLFIA
ncbi:hypothetical protein [Wolbachia pipientis]|uniref:hypothetical protein n=1 Tax=Wolbachia pipientis TaxID=955 RepID=UPI0021C983D4|nr:hypothetical protein [Wolbachia pipientis]